ncbi:MAG: SHD1 domain-containing protein [Planctomycetota bacterium]|nr:SHD1 domain-containing protein [Planctomycetota bacterium]
MGTRIGLCLLAACLVATTAQAEPLRYRWAADGQFVYDIEITADLPDAVETLTGKIVFQVKSTDSPAKISYRGGLTKATKKKPSASSNGPRGPFDDVFGRPPAFGSPFDRPVNPFKGLEQTTNEVVVSSTGSILAMEGSSQLPYLLGNLSLLVFEPLSETEQANWKVESGVTISEKSDRRQSFGPFDPFARREGPEKTMAAGESTSFVKEGVQGDLSTFKRTFRLNSPGDGTSFNIDGTGRWVFNTKLGISESLEFQQKLTIKSDNVSVNVPVSIKYRRLSNDEWQKMEAERIEFERPKSEEEVYRAAVAKVSAGGTPSSTEVEKIVAATKANLKPILDKAYESANECKVLGPWVTYDTPLPKGLVVAANMYSQPETKYFPGTIDSILENGLIKVRYSYRAGATEDRLREDIFIAPEVVEQKQLSPEQKAELQTYRDRVKQELESSADGAEATERVIRSYRDGTQPVLKVGDAVPNDLSLPKFMVVAAKKPDGKWYQAHISADVLPDGKVSLRFSTDRADSNVARSDLRLPPYEVKAPNLPPTYKTSAPPSSPSRSSPPPTVSDAFRTWTDSTGEFKVEAKLVSATADAVKIVRNDGKELTLPLTKLSDADRQFVASLKKSENPFE